MTKPQPIIPVLVYDDIKAVHDFLVDAFGLESGGVTVGADGRPVQGATNRELDRARCAPRIAGRLLTINREPTP